MRDLLILLAGIIPRTPANTFLRSLTARHVPRAPQTSLTSFLTTAPADNSIAPSQFKLWLDDAPGATKLMVRAKDSDGTVRQGSIALS